MRLLAAVLLLLLSIVFVVPASAQPADPPTELFDVDFVVGKPKVAAWRPRTDLKVFRTARGVLYTDPEGPNKQPVNVTAPAGSFLLLGGDADIWISTDGFKWFIVAGPSAATYSYIPTAWKTTYTYEVGQSIAKDRTTDRLYIMRDNRVFVSDDAHKFTAITAVGLPNRWYSPSVTDRAGTVYSMSGDSTYASTDGGFTWSWRSSFTWVRTDRIDHFAATYYSTQYSKDLIYVMGGRPGLNDVWVTSDGAVTWVQLSGSAAWAARYDGTVNIADNGVLVVSAGRPNDWDYFNDVWVSVDGGYNWWVLRNYAGFTPRVDPGSIIDSNGYLWIFGGTQTVYVEDVAQQSPTNAIARSTHSFNSVLDWVPKVNRQFYGPSATCLGLTCWPNSSSCASGCDLPGDFNFRALPPGPFLPRYFVNIVQTKMPITYKAVLNGVNTTVTAPVNSYIMFGGVIFLNGAYLPTNDGWISDGPTNLATWRPLYGTAANASGLSQNVDYVSPTSDWGQVGCGYTSATETILYLIGGGQPVQRSTDGGKRWVTLSTQILWNSWGACVVLPNSKAVVSFAWNTAWVSRDNGATFAAVTTKWPGGRDAPSSVAYYSTQLQKEAFFIIGGVYDWTRNLNDVLVSLDGGVTFDIVTANAPFQPRADARAVIHSTGVMAIFAGQAGRFLEWYNDAWFSADGGYHWFELTSSDAITPRNFPATILTNDNRILSIAGNRLSGGYTNDIYISEERFKLDESVLTWGEVVAPPFRFQKPSSVGCLGLACAPNTTNCACRPQSRFNVLPTGYRGSWSVRFLNAVSRLTNPHTYVIKQNGVDVNISMPANSWVQFGGGLNDVWVSSNKGQTWYEIAGPDLAGTVPARFQDSFISREGQAYCTTPFDDTIYALGGKDYYDWSATSWSREVWRSTDGQDWVIAQDGTTGGDLVWPGRAYVMCVVDSNLALYTTGGNNDAYGQIDESTYVSADGGYTWDKVKTAKSYPGRAAFTGGATWGRLLGKTLIYAMAGVGNRNFNDVWVTSDGAKNWAVVSGSAPWAPRADTFCAFADDGAIVMHGGQANWFENWYSDVWMSIDGGYNWWEVTPNYGARPRTFAATLIDEQGYLYVFGGNVIWAWSNEILRSTLSFSQSEVRVWGPELIPNIVLPAQFGLACWPGLGSAACRYTVYPIPTPESLRRSSSSSSSSSSTGLAPAIDQGAAASSSSSLTGGSIAGIVIGVIIGVIVFFFLGIFLGLGFAKRGGKTSNDGGSFQPQRDVELSRNTESHVETA